MLIKRFITLLLPAAILLSACSTSPTTPIPTMEKVNLQRFMGDWYVIANIPTFIEKGAHNAVESYRIDDDGSIATTFTFNKDAFDGKKKTYTPRGFVIDQNSNAVWGMRFVWPIKADYRIVFVDPEYKTTIVGRQQRDYVWIMARTPAISEQAYRELLERVKNIGYDLSKVKRVPQQSSSPLSPMHVDKRPHGDSSHVE
jgi:apolipoprotein D and lipocalin family protein